MPQKTNSQSGGNKGRRFISVIYRCCNTYGRLYPDAKRSRFEGRCPKCGTHTEARIGRDGSTRNCFEAR